MIVSQNPLETHQELQRSLLELGIAAYEYSIDRNIGRLQQVHQVERFLSDERLEASAAEAVQELLGEKVCSLSDINTVIVRLERDDAKDSVWCCQILNAPSHQRSIPNILAVANNDRRLENLGQKLEEFEKVMRTVNQELNALQNATSLAPVSQIDFTVEIDETVRIHNLLHSQLPKNSEFSGRVTLAQYSDFLDDRSSKIADLSECKLILELWKMSKDQVLDSLSSYDVDLKKIVFHYQAWETYSINEPKLIDDLKQLLDRLPSPTLQKDWHEVCLAHKTERLAPSNSLDSFLRGIQEAETVSRRKNLLRKYLNLYFNNAYFRHCKIGNRDYDDFLETTEKAIGSALRSPSLETLQQVLNGENLSMFAKTLDIIEELRLKEHAKIIGLDPKIDQQLACYRFEDKDNYPTRISLPVDMSNSDSLFGLLAFEP
ncbi:MAG TPA: hypothetical protein DDW52_28030 [Planctomycetaceae bacterium]|nr:hypothetical protein [Planctomycetaceae bacterium]